MNNSGTVPTPIVNSLGIATTVHRKPVPVPAGGRRAFPSPGMKASKMPETHESRVKRITARNTAWESGKRPPAEVRNAVAIKALPIVGGLITISVNSDNRPAAEQFVESVESCVKAGDYETLIIAERFAPIAYIISESDEDATFGESYPIDFKNFDISGWEPEYVGINDFDEVTGVINGLRDIRLLSYDEIPDKTDQRFFAHLYMSSTRTLMYDSAMGGEDNDFIMLVDEFPEHTSDIKELMEQGLHAPGVRARITGEVTPSLSEGVL